MLIWCWTLPPIQSVQVSCYVNIVFPKCVKPLLNATKVSATGVNGESEDIIDNCTIPLCGKSSLACVDILKCVHRNLFCKTPGQTQLAKSFIPTNGRPVKTPRQRIPAQFWAEVEEQTQAMLQDGITEKSSSPWMSPAVFVHKKNCDVLICLCRRLCTEQADSERLMPPPTA